MGVTTLTKAEIYEKYADQLIRFATGLVGPSDGRDVVSAAVVNAMWSASWDSVVYERAYLYKAVLNEARRHHRSNGRRHIAERQAYGGAETDGLPEFLTRVSALRRLLGHFAVRNEDSAGRLSGQFHLLVTAISNRCC